MAGGALAAPLVGFADDATKYSDDGGAPMFGKLHALGGGENRVAVYWDPAQPAVIQEQDFLDRMLPVAAAGRRRRRLQRLPALGAHVLDRHRGGIAQFAEYLRLLAVTSAGPHLRGDERAERGVFPRAAARPERRDPLHRDRVPGARSRLRRRSPSRLSVGSGKTFIHGGDRIPANFSGALPTGTYVIVVQMSAAANPRRSTTAVSQALTIS